VHIATDDLSKMIDGKPDALLRTSLQPPPGLHVDRIELRVFVTLPELAGCREHWALVRFLRSARSDSFAEFTS
jgi:hypothetical protein